MFKVKNLLTSIFLLSLAGSLSAQFSIGVEGGYSRYLHQQGNLMGGLRMEFFFSEQFAVSLKGNYLLPGKFSGRDSVTVVNAGSSYYSHQDVEYELTGMSASLSAKKYIFNARYGDPLAFYLCLGIGYVQFDYTKTFTTGTAQPANPKILTTLSTITINPSVGFDYVLAKNNMLFFEIGLMLPPKPFPDPLDVSYNPSVKIPNAGSVTIGYRFGKVKYTAKQRFGPRRRGNPFI